MRWREKILRLLYPPKCVFCGRLLDEEEPEVCAGCRSTLLTGKYREFRRGSYFEKCVFALRYEGLVRRSILRFKFRGRSRYATAYGAILSDCVAKELFGRYDVIAWVPVSARQRRKRGYNQAELLAKSAAKRLNITAEPLLRKVRDTDTQSRIRDAARRRANVAGAFAADRAAIRGRRVLLIDDIVTTGATLSECARSLLMAGAEEVVCAALAGRDG